MFVFPIASIVVEALLGHGPLWPAIVGKWFVFWSVGVRLCLAGLRQMIQPGYTAQVILSLKGDESHLVVRELGAANFAIGLVALASIGLASWQPAGALAGGVFYTIAGIGHARKSGRARLQNIAMISDLFVGSVLLAVVVSMLASLRTAFG